MGNCLKGSGVSDDMSLLRETGPGAGRESIDQQMASPIYSEILQPVFYPAPSVSHPPSNLTEEEQIKIAKRIGLIQHLPMGSYDDGCQKKSRECVICMNEFTVGESLRYLPCMHKYHIHCIDDWLLRSKEFTCPQCLEPVDAALISSYETA